MNDMHGQKKGQAGIAFLISYGWVAAVVLLIATILIYTGIIGTHLFNPNKCVMESTVSCTVEEITPKEITLTIVNNNEPITITNIRASNCKEKETSIKINQDHQSQVKFTDCDNQNEESFIKAPIIIEFTKNTQTPTTIFGTFSGKITS